MTSRDDMARSGASSIPEALRLAPGVEVARMSNNRWAVSIRGFNGRFANKLLVLKDGRSVHSPLFFGVVWEAEDVLLDDIDRIEVIRGPGAAMWGSNESGLVSVRRGFRLVGRDIRLSFKGFDRAPGKSPDATQGHDRWQAGRIRLRGDWQAGEFQRRLPLGRHELTWGASHRYSHDHLEVTSPTIFGASAFNRPHRDWRLSGLQAQPDVRLAWTPDPAATVWSSLSRATRTPSRPELDVPFKFSETPAIPPYVPAISSTRASLRSSWMLPRGNQFDVWLENTSRLNSPAVPAVTLLDMRYACRVQPGSEVGGTLRLCLSGADRFGPALDVLQGRLANARVIELHRRPRGQSLKDCQVVFLADPFNTDGIRALDELRGLPVLTVGDSPGAAQLGVALNMVETSGRMDFEVNLYSARAGRIKISSKLLQLAREVIQ